MIRDEDALEYHAAAPHGKISLSPTKPCLTQRDLSLAYTPGVAAPCLAIQQNPELVYEYTSKSNLVAVVTNGTAVLGLGNIGPAAGKPVMEGKAVLFKRFADIDVFDLELATNDPKEVIRACELLEPTFGGINLEDIRAPECFEIEETLQRTLSIPVFHDDQHGTAIISGAALLNGLEIVGKRIAEVRIVFNGAGASAIACAEHYIRLGARRENIILCDTKGVIFAGRTDGMNKYKQRFASATAARSLSEAMAGADVFFGLSAGHCVTPDMLLGMTDNPLLFALSNPTPEIDYEVAMRTRPDVIMATGRSDYPNQVNNVLGFPSVFRGALDVRATAINDEMKIAATKALAQLAKQGVPESVARIYTGESLDFGRQYLIPKAFDPRVVITVATAVAEAAIRTGVAKRQLNLAEYRESLQTRLGTRETVVQGLIRKAKLKTQRLVLTDGEEDAVLRACQVLLDENIAHPILLGDAGRIQSRASDLRLELSKAEIIEPANAATIPIYAEELYRVRHRKGITRTDARTMISQQDLFAAMMLHLGDADAVLAGWGRHYPAAVRAGLQVIPMQAGVRKASGLYLLLTPQGKLYFFADCTVNIDPTPEDLAEITLCAAEMAHRFDVEPRVALLSHSNFGSSRHPAAEKVRRAVEIVRERVPTLQVEGEMQADTAVVPDIIESTYPFSFLKGGANVLVFPNMDAANIAYKLLARIGGAHGIGPVLMGLAKPFHVLQKGADVNDIINMAAVAVVQAQETPCERNRARQRLMKHLLSQPPSPQMA